MISAPTNPPANIIVSPRSMRSHGEIERRKAMLGMPHISPLAGYVSTLRNRLELEVPDFDPLDGGVEARALFLFEKPGPMTSEEGRTSRTGSGFISRDNDDPTAEATLTFMRQAGIPRTETVLWNTVPAWNGTRQIAKEELLAGLACVDELVSLLPRLRVVVLVGKKAGKAKQHVKQLGCAVVTSTHPSPLVRARWPGKWAEIGQQWSSAMMLMDG